MRTLSFSLAFVLAGVSCVSVDTDNNENIDNLPDIDGPTIEFDPSNRIIPFPNNLLLNPMTGIVTLPASCNESPSSQAVREGLLNALNGFATFKSPISVTFTEAVDPDSLTGNVKLYQIARAGMPLDPATATEIPMVIIPGQTTRDSADCTSTAVIDNASFVPLVPLEGDSTFAVAVVGNILTAGGEQFLPSFTWTLIRGAENPVTIDEAGNIVADRTPLDPFNADDETTLRGVDLLWKAHAGALAFLAGTGLVRNNIQIAWAFNTQATTRPLDPGVTGSLAEAVPTTALLGTASILGGATPTQFLNVARFPAGGTCTVGTNCPCDSLPCNAVGDIVGSAFNSPQYQSPRPNPLAGGDPVPGPWAEPIAPAEVAPELIGSVAFIPVTAAPANGYPTIIFGHGLTRSRNDLFAIGSQLAAFGFASIAIDWVAHGSRAVKVSDVAALGCDVATNPTLAPQCFAPILSTDLAVTRDNVRQTVLDALGLIAATKACGTAGCGALSVDGTRMGYIGQSLGSIMGTLIVSMSPDIRAAVLNVGGVGLIDVVENTDNLGIRCSIVNGLIAAGVIAGTVNETCLGEEWKMDPGYRRFAVIARWSLDPADGANYLARLAGKSILIQEVIDDAVVPNFATEQQTALLQLTAAAAPPSVNPTTVSPEITANPADSKWMTYATLPPDGGTGFPGNAYAHGSLLAPSAGQAGGLGTALLQRDALTYLLQNTQP